MNGNSFFIDTNIALYLLAGSTTLATLLDGNEVHLSFVSELELLGYRNIKKKEHDTIKSFLNDCRITDINEDIKILTIALRKKYQLKLPDAIIASTAIYLDLPLLTADKQFKHVKELELILFEE